MATVHARQHAGKSWTAVWDGAFVSYHGCGRTRDAAFAGLWLDIWRDRRNIEAETLTTWLCDVEEARVGATK